MQIVRNHINEKFREDSDPVHDLGIGLTEIIKKAKNKMIDYDSEYKFEYKQLTTNVWEFCTELLMDIHIIYINNKCTIVFSCFSNTFRDAKNKKIINKYEYCKKLLDVSGIIEFTNATKFNIKNLFTEKDPDPLCTSVSFEVSQNYVKFFKEYF